MTKTLYRIKIDVDLSATTTEAALKKLGEALQAGNLRAGVKIIHAHSVEPYPMYVCYICEKTRPAHEMTFVGPETYRCPTHTQATIIKKTKELKKARALEKRAAAKSSR